MTRVSLVRRLAAAVALLDARAFHGALALCLGLWACASYVLEEDAHLRGVQYDWMVRHRLYTPSVDPDIVILDIDERSLARMSGEFGRWPWPRDVLAAALSDLEAQGAQAVVFDILFADPDRVNAAGDRALADAVATSRRSYFSVLRLNPANDGASALHARQLPGLVGLGDDPRAGERTLALVPPFFASAVASGRLGTHNIRPDADGVIRRYHLWEDAGGARIASLPQRLSETLGWPQQAQGAPLLQWMARPMAFPLVSFADYYFDTQHTTRTRPRDEFKGKIVVIGATAASLFDVKATPLAGLQPGVEVLATAIDNARNNRFLHELGRLPRLLLSLALLVLMAWLSVRYPHERMEFAFLLAPASLLLVSYASLNTGRLFIDLSGPASLALIYFTVAKVHSQLVRRYWSGEAPFVRPHEDDVPLHIIGLTLSWPRGYRQAAFERRFHDALRHRAPHARALLRAGHTSGALSAVLEQVAVAVWLVAGEDAVAAADALREREALAQALAAHGAPRIGRAEAAASVPSTDDGQSLAERMRAVVFQALAGPEAEAA